MMFSLLSNNIIIIIIIVIIIVVVVDATTKPFSGNSLVLRKENVCSLATLIPFTDLREGPPSQFLNDDDENKYYGYGQYPNARSLGKNGYSLLATVHMAVDHFNNRNASIIAELGDLECPITLDATYNMDSAFDRKTSVAAINRVQFANDTATAAAVEEEYYRYEQIQPAICAILGPTFPRTNEGISVLSEFFGIPQIAYSTIDIRLSRQDDFPNLIRFLPSSVDFAKTVAMFIQRDIYQRNYVAILYDQSDYGEQFEDPLENMEERLGYETLTEHIWQVHLDTIESAMDEVLENGYHTIVLITDKLYLLDEIAHVADEKGLLGETYFWILSGEAFPPAMWNETTFPVDSPVDKLLRGAAMFTNFDPFFYRGESDPFLRAWRSQTTDLVNRITANVPLSPDQEGYYAGSADFFQEETPPPYASFLYDATIAAGLSACHVLSDNPQKQQPFRKRPNHVREIFKLQFQGASGSVQFKKQQNGRSSDGVVFGMHNIRPSGTLGETGRRRYDVVLTHLYNDKVTGKWTTVDDTEFLFYDGTSKEPMPLKTVVNFNYVSNGVMITGLVLLSIAMFLTIASGTWVFVMRNERIVKAAQPEFLYLLCVGCAMLESTLLFESFDEDKGFSQETLSAMCSAVPWLSVIGYLTMYSALFSKLWRLNKLLMHRQAVAIYKVLVPFCFLLVFVLVVLIVWRCIDPFVWQRTVISTYPLITYGQCDNQGGSIVPYIVILSFLLGTITVMTIVMAWRLRNVQSELSESRWIFFGIFINLQTWVIGIPVYMILDNVSKDASYLIAAALFLSLPVSMVACVIWPKIWNYTRNKYFRRQHPMKQGIMSTTVSGGGGSTNHYNNNNNNNNNNNVYGGSDGDDDDHVGEDIDVHDKDNDDKRKIRILKNEIEALQSQLNVFRERSATIITDNNDHDVHAFLLEAPVEVIGSSIRNNHDYNDTMHHSNMKDDGSGVGSSGENHDDG